MTTLRGVCQRCKREVEFDRDTARSIGHDCGKAAARPPAKESDESSSRGEKRKAAVSPTFSNARPTDCLSGHRHPSTMEANVCNRLIAECTAAGETLFRQVKMPLLAIDPKPGGKPFTLCLDFAIRSTTGAVRFVEAKSKRICKSWPAREAAFRAQYKGTPLDVVDR